MDMAGVLSASMGRIVFVLVDEVEEEVVAVEPMTPPAVHPKTCCTPPIYGVSSITDCNSCGTRTVLMSSYRLDTKTIAKSIMLFPPPLVVVVVDAAGGGRFADAMAIASRIAIDNDGLEE